MAGLLVPDAHELTSELAYRLWEQRGRAWGFPEVDWFAAEKAMASAQRDPKLDLPLWGAPWEPTRNRLVPLDRQTKSNSN